MQKDKGLALLTKHGKNIDAQATDEVILDALTALVADNKVTDIEAKELKEPAKNVMTRGASKANSYQLVVGLLLGFIAGGAQAAPITPGNLVVYRVGNGSAGLNNTATAVFLDEYTVTGTLVQSLALPTSGGTAFTIGGTAVQSGAISRSQDGNYLIFTGYRKATGGSSPSSDNWSTTPRVIGTLDSSGTMNTTTTLTSDGGATTASQIFSATSVDGKRAFWTATSSAVGYNNTPFTSGGTTWIDAGYSRQVNLSGNTLFAAKGDVTTTGKLRTYGSLPTSATAPTVAVNMPNAMFDNIIGFTLFDLDNSVAGDDTLYCLTNDRLWKFTYNGSSWRASGSISSFDTSGLGANNLTGYANGSTVNLYLTAARVLYGYSDASGYGGTATGSVSLIATARANTAFRGIGMFSTIPQLTIERTTPNTVRLLWPTNPAGFNLECNTNLAGTNWLSVSPSPSIIGTNNVVTNATTEAQMFYRLKK